LCWILYNFSFLVVLLLESRLLIWVLINHWHWHELLLTQLVLSIRGLSSLVWDHSLNAWLHLWHEWETNWHVGHHVLVHEVVESLGGLSWVCLSYLCAIGLAVCVQHLLLHGNLLRKHCLVLLVHLLMHSHLLIDQLLLLKHHLLLLGSIVAWLFSLCSSKRLGLSSHWHHVHIWVWNSGKWISSKLIHLWIRSLSCYIGSGLLSLFLLLSFFSSSLFIFFLYSSSFIFFLFGIVFF